MAHVEYSSAELARLASMVLRDPNASPAAKSLAGSVLTQARDHDNAMRGSGEYVGNAMARYMYRRR